MLPEVRSALQRLLYERGRIPTREVDIRFEAPTKEWIDALTRPTISFFLFDVHENTDLRRTDFQTTRANGHATRRLPPRRLDLQYMVSAITTEIEDEYRLLWRTLVTLMKHPEFPARVLPDDLTLEMPLTARILSAEDSPRFPDMWTALGSPPRPAVAYTVTVPVDLEVVLESPLVLTSTTRYRRIAASGAPDTRIHVGGVVRDRDGRPVEGVTVTREGSTVSASVTNRDGWFVLNDVPAGPVTLRADPAGGQATTATFDVPSDSYDIILE